MKPYVAKYLPVKGEIKEGMLFRRSEGDFCKLIKWEKEDEQYRWCLVENDRGFQHLYAGGKSIRPVMLFLCSRDKQVGDTVFHTDGNYGVVESRRDMLYIVRYESSFCSAGHTNDLVKIVGGISTDALWVKDGDVFDEDQVRRNHICHDTPGNIGCCFHCSRSKGCDSEDYNYLIKGPCGHFH